MLDFVDGIKGSVLERPDGALTLGRRQWLWGELARQHPGDACLRQSILGHLVCDGTAAAWDSLPLGPTDKRLYCQFRALCQSILLGELGHAAALERFTDLDCHAHVLDFPGDWDGYFAIRAVRAACLEAMRREPPPVPMPVNLELTEAKTDFDDFDPHVLASCIPAGGVAWEGSSDPNRRRAFWLDWLEKLYPLAFSNRSDLLELVRSQQG